MKFDSHQETQEHSICYDEQIKLIEGKQGKEIYVFNLFLRGRLENLPIATRLHVQEFTSRITKIFCTNQSDKPLML